MNAYRLDSVVRDTRVERVALDLMIGVERIRA